VIGGRRSSQALPLARAIRSFRARDGTAAADEARGLERVKEESHRLISCVSAVICAVIHLLFA
jgi:hypothetical protein